MKYITLVLLILPFFASSQIARDCGEFKQRSYTTDWQLIERQDSTCKHEWVMSRVEPYYNIYATLEYCPCCGTDKVTGYQYRICTECGQHEEQVHRTKTWYEPYPMTAYELELQKYRKETDQDTLPVITIRGEPFYIDSIFTYTDTLILPNTGTYIID